MNVYLWLLGLRAGILFLYSLYNCKLKLLDSKEFKIEKLRKPEEKNRDGVDGEELKRWVD